LEGGSSSPRDLPESFQFAMMGRNAHASISDVAKGFRTEKSRDKSENREKENGKRGGGGAKGDSTIRTSVQGSRTELDFRLIRNSLATCTNPSAESVDFFVFLFSFFFFCHFSFLLFYKVRFADRKKTPSLIFPFWNKTPCDRRSASFEREDPCLFPLPSTRKA
jgi:hypothetical protein